MTSSSIYRPTVEKLTYDGKAYVENYCVNPINLNIKKHNFTRISELHTVRYYQYIQGGPFIWVT